jgi:FSR family fosmidomycin resistance protein-like MFS transporter
MTVESAVADQPAISSEFQTSRVLTITAGHALHDTYTAFLSPLLPLLIERLSLSLTSAGLLSALIQLPSVLQPIIGYVADRASLRFVVILAPAVTTPLMSLLGLAPSYAILAFLLLIVGLSSASFHAVAPAVAASLSGANLGRGMGFFMVGGELGRTVGPVIIVGAVGLLTLEKTYWLLIPGLLGSALLYRRLADLSAQAPANHVQAVGPDTLRSLMRFLLPLLGIVAARAFMSAALTTYLPVFLSQDGAALWFAGVSLSVLEGAGVVGALLGGSISDRVGRRTVLLISLVGASLLMFTFLGVSGWVRLPILVGLGLGALSINPVLLALVQESFPDNRALANGAYMASSFLIRSGALVALGALGDAFSLRTSFVVSAIVPLAGLPLLLLVPRTRSG